MSSRVFFIIVCYEPDIETVRENISSLARECFGGTVVNNSVDAKTEVLEETVRRAGEHFHIINNAKNLGIAMAINQGIEMALASEADYLLIMDDDSTLADDALARMIQVCSDLQSRGERVAAVGPCFEDKVTGRSGVFPVFRGLRTERHRCSDTGGAQFRCEFLMSSGSLIPRTAIETVGIMREELFIDLVDIEWCLRARSKDWYCHVACEAKMEHNFGSHCLPLGYVSYRPPLRHYYIFRNSIFVFGLSYMPFAWKLHQSFYLIKLFINLFLSPDRFTQVNHILKGIRDGFSKRMGPAEDTL